jgi:hypothetical protein
MITLSTTTANINGNVIIKESMASDTGAKTARVTRTATLDGGVYISHSGYTDGDRTLRIKGRITEAQATILNSLFEDHTSCLIGLKDGLYFGAISTLNTQNGSLKMNFLIENKEN